MLRKFRNQSNTEVNLLKFPTKKNIIFKIPIKICLSATHQFNNVMCNFKKLTDKK